MSGTVDRIAYAMSLREPQKQALHYLDSISECVDYRHNTKADVEAAASQHSEHHRTVIAPAEFDFPSFCFSMATGIGKTRLMGACIYYLYKTKGYRHFFILAPGSTIYDKLRKESNPAHPKYIFKGLEEDIQRPNVYDGENYTSYPVAQPTLLPGKQPEIELFIFNIGKIFNSKQDAQFNFHKYKETLGASFSEVLAGFDDLVICMDEAHHYYAPASMKAVNYLKPILGLEFTATPKWGKNVIYSYDLKRGAAEGYLKTPVVMGRTNMAGYSEDDIEEMKIRDGLTLHEHRKATLKQYCYDHELPYVKPIVLIACKDTNHAKTISKMIDSDDFLDGKYKNKVVEIHSNMKGEESEENIRRLLTIERNDNPMEIVLHVYKLKEGWDVNNLFTIIPLNAAKSDILAMQTIGRGLRLPFGKITGNEDIDTLDIVAHEHYRELVAEISEEDPFHYRDLDEDEPEPTDSVEVETTVPDGQLDLLDGAFGKAGVKSFQETGNTQTMDQLYKKYLDQFGEKGGKKKTDEGKQQPELFGNDNITDAGKTTGLYGTATAAGGTSPDRKTDAQVNRGKRPMTRQEFDDTVHDYAAKAISVPKITVQTSSTVTFHKFKVVRNIADFEMASAKIERFDAVNLQLLSAIDAQILEVDNARNTLACMLLDRISELSYDDADFIMDVVDQYLALIEGSDEDKRRIVRRYATLIVNDIRKQVYEHKEEKTWIVHDIVKDLILFKKFVKSVKKDGVQRYDKPFTDAAHIKKYLFTGYKKAYYPQNAFECEGERIFSIVLEEDPEVLRWIKTPPNQLGIFWKAGQQYNPDFLVETSNMKYMVEVVPEKEIVSADTISKAKEAVSWCMYATTADPDKKRWKYCLLSEKNIAAGNTCRYILSTAQPVVKE